MNPAHNSRIPGKSGSQRRCQESIKLKSNSIGAYDHFPTQCIPQNSRIARNFHHFILHLFAKQVQLWKKILLSFQSFVTINRKHQIETTLIRFFKNLIFKELNLSRNEIYNWPQPYYLIYHSGRVPQKKINIKSA